MISIKINLSLLDKSRFFKGEKGTYCDLILIETPGGKYGDYICKQSVTKEEREAKVQLPILGNGKNLGKGSQRQAPAAAQESDDVPPF